MNTTFGTNGFGKSTFDWELGKAPQYSQEYQSTGSADIYASASVYYEKGWKVHGEFDAGTYKMVATLNNELSGDNITPISGSGSFVTIEYGMRFNPTEKDILHVSNTTVGWLSQITDKDKTTLDNFIQNPPITGSINWSSTDPNGPFSGSSSSSISASQEIWTMTRNGFKTVPIVAPVLRATLTVPRNYDMTNVYANVFRIYHKNTVSGEIYTPDFTPWFNIMAQDTDPAPFPCDNGGTIPYLYGWRKEPPNADKNGQVITIQMEWTYGLWPQAIFGTRL